MPSWSTESSDHNRRSSGSASSNRFARSLALDAERLLLAPVGHAEPERRQQPSVGQEVERRQLLGQQRRVASRQHEHREAELQLLRPPGGDRQPDDRVDGAPGHPLAQPQRVEPVRLEPVHQRREAGASVCRRCRCRGRSRCGSSRDLQCALHVGVERAVEAVGAGLDVEHARPAFCPGRSMATTP